MTGPATTSYYTSAYMAHPQVLSGTCVLNTQSDTTKYSSLANKIINSYLLFRSIEDINILKSISELTDEQLEKLVIFLVERNRRPSSIKIFVESILKKRLM